MVILIQSTASLLQASGVINFTTQGQAGGPTLADALLQTGSPYSFTTGVSKGAPASLNEVVQFGGKSQTADLILASNEEVISSSQLNVYFPEFSRGTTIFGVIGTADTVEKFFDRSPFFYLPPETDPNTLRDLSEAQQFLLFSSTSVFGVESVRNIPSFTTVISIKGDTFDESVLSARNLLSNGSFESDLSTWEIETGHSLDIAEVVSAPPTGVGLDGISPVDGEKMLYMSKQATDGVLFVKATEPLSKLKSSQLETFQFSLALAEVLGRRFMLSIGFYLTGIKQHIIEYNVHNIIAPSPKPPEISFPSSHKTTDPGFIAGVFNTFIQDIRADMGHATFDFDEVKVWVVTDGTTVPLLPDLLIDNIILTAKTPPDHFKFTESLAHVITTHPTASGFPFTISGSDDILQIDQTGPFFDETSPASGTSFNLPDTQVQFHIEDGGSALDPATINVFIDALQVVEVGATVTGTVWPIASKIVLAPNNIEYIFTRSEPFPQQSVVTVSGQMADFASPPNLTNSSYEFTILGSGSLNATISGAFDLDAPVITIVEPTPGQTQVSPDTDILWTTSDNASGVDPSTIRLLLNTGVRVDGDTVTAGILNRAANASLGFNDTYNPEEPFIFGSTVTGTIEAQDFSGNPVSSTYEFTITPDDTLEITNFFLNEDQSVLLVSGTELSVCVEDFTHGVNVSGTFFTINEVVPSGLVTAISGTPSSGTGPAKVTFSVLLEPLVDFREDLTIFVHAENNFPGNYPVIKEKIYVLRPGYDVVWPNKVRDSEGGPAEIFPYLKNFPVLIDIKNYARNFGTASEWFRIRTESQSYADLSANLISNIEVADLSATLMSLNPFFVYGKTMTLEIGADDLEGNQLRFTHVFTIETKPI